MTPLDRHELNAARRSRESEDGFALVVSMIFLAILTALGINAMRSSALEEKMAANTQQQGFSFQSAETGLTLGFSGAAAATTNIDSEKTFKIVDGSVCGTESTPDCESDTAPAKTVRLKTRVWYNTEGKVPPPGYSLDGPFATHHFSMSSDASYGTTRTELLQGFRRLGPRSDQ